MSDNFFIIGGDMRNVYLANYLAEDEKNVKIMGFDEIYGKNLLNNKIKKVQHINEENLKKEFNQCVVISAIPLTLDNNNINAPFSKDKISLKILRNTKLIAGKIPNFLNGFDILEDETFTIKNIIPTVEGAISKAIETTKITIQDSNILVLGYGRIGKMLSNKLKLLGANVYTEARKEKDLAWIKANGFHVVNIENLEKEVYKMDIIFNTIPHLILTEKIINKMKKSTIIIDLASKPGGTNFEYAKKVNINAQLYGGIPGKIAPKSTAKYMRDFIYKCNI